MTFQPGRIDQQHCCMDDGSNKIIQQLQFLTHDNDVIQQRLERLDMLPEQMATVIRSLEYLMRSVNHLGRLEKERKHGQKRKQRPTPKKNKTFKASDVSSLLHLPTALQENILHFLENLSFKPTEISDKLVENECLSEDESMFIRAQSSDKDQVRMLVRKIKTRGPNTIKLFLETIQKDQPHLAEKVYKSLERITEEKKQKPICGICLMTKTVDLKDISDILWQKDIINDNIYAYVVESAHKDKRLIWQHIIDSINCSENPETSRNILMQALQKKYNHIFEALKEIQGEFLPSCCCSSRQKFLRRSRAFSSGSTASEVPKFDKIFGDSTDSDSQSALSSFDFSSSFKGFFDLTRYVNGDINGNVACDSTTNDNAQSMKLNFSENNLVPTETNDRKRRSTETFMPNEEHFNLPEEDYNQSLPFVSSSENNTDNDLLNGKDITRQLSHVTICPAQSTTSGDISDPAMLTDDSRHNRTSESTDQSPNLDVNIRFQLPVTDEKKADGAITFQENSNIESATDLTNRPKRRQRYLRNSEDDSACDDDDNEYFHLRRRRYKPKTGRRKYLERQRSAPVGEIITQPRSAFDQSATNVGTRQNASRMSKTNKKRAERRIRASSFNDPDQAEEQQSVETDAKIPYNPSWTNRAQVRHIPTWDYNQARRYWLMASKMAESEKRRKIKSDSELRSDSDTVGYSEYTV